jgi:hypothetical protein
MVRRKLTSPFEDVAKTASNSRGSGGSRFTRLAQGLNRKRGEMNQTEAAYEKWVLEPAKEAGEILDWWYEPLTVRLSHPPAGQPAKYTPDFMILAADGTVYMDDVKGSGPDDPAAIVRIKSAAEIFPLFVWRLAKKQKTGQFSQTPV